MLPWKEAAVELCCTRTVGPWRWWVCGARFFSHEQQDCSGGGGAALPSRGLTLLPVLLAARPLEERGPPPVRSALDIVWGLGTSLSLVLQDRLRHPSSAKSFSGLIRA